jgi:hypothetical protein
VDQDLWNAIRKIVYKIYTEMFESIFKVLSKFEINWDIGQMAVQGLGLWTLRQKGGSSIGNISSGTWEMQPEVSPAELGTLIEPEPAGT